MKSLICSDSHDHVQNLVTALKVADTAGCDAVIACGDLCSAFMLSIYHKHCKLPLHMVFGNNDGDRYHLLEKATQLNKERESDQQILIHGEFLLADKGHSHAGIPSHIAFAVYHYPEMARIIAASGKYNVVCCGHSHKSSIEKINDTIFLNPGSLMGFIPGTTLEPVKPSCIVINWSTGELELIDI